MRRRISRALFATAAAGATIATLGFAAAGSAGAATTAHRARAINPGDPPSAPLIYTNANCTVPSPLPSTLPANLNCGRAGYQASGRTFRYAQALVQVPTVAGVDTVDPQIYVALDNTGSASTYTFVRAGVSPCATAAVALTPACPAGNTSGWVAYVQAMRNGTMLVDDTVSLANSMEGDRVFASLYRESSGSVVDAQIRLPDGTVYHYTVDFPGGTFGWAQAQADWTSAHLASTTATTAPNYSTLVKVRDTQFMQGGFTTVTGDRGTFSGPWTLSAPEATSNGTAAGTLIAEPSYLWNDGIGGGWGDAFGVWRFPF